MISSVNNLAYDFNTYLLITISLLLIIVSIKIVFSKNLLETIIMMSLFSMFISLIYLIMDAPDVAMTEIALGACLSSCVLLNFINITGFSVSQNVSKYRVIISSILCLLFIIILTWAGLDLVEYGSNDSPLQTYVSKYYIEHTKEEIGIKSMVASVLASYRSFDTLGETMLILIAGLSVLLILSTNKTKS